jgi:protein-tyrosine kinase
VINGVNDRTLIVRDDPKAPGAEAFRTLRTNLQFSRLDKQIKTILVTSSGPGEGKTTISSNLAISLAQAGSKVIIAGVDLRRPAIDKQFNVSNTIGVTNILTGQYTLDEALQDTDVEGLRILTSGPIPPNPAELLSSQRMKDLIEQIKSKADYIIFDATPVIAVSDSVILSQMVDGVLLVVSLGITPRGVAITSKEQLERVGANILGVVANNISEESGYYYYYYHHYYVMDNDQSKTGWLRRIFKKKSSHTDSV